jgi:hypothetical protein
VQGYRLFRPASLRQTRAAAKEDTNAGWARGMPGFFETIGAKMLAA